MSEIRVLPDELVNQIAAGEVVERPASVVKELVENALDAEATRVRIAIAEGGMRLIAVDDDGRGMGRSDAELAFRRHATSKIRHAEDLSRIATLGFRGEALPSIAAVASLRMRTRRSDAALGVELVGTGAGIERVRELACPIGTHVEVGELFGKIPARRKFLKTALTESSHVVRWIERIALCCLPLLCGLPLLGRLLLLCCSRLLCGFPLLCRLPLLCGLLPLCAFSGTRHS